MQRRTVLKGAAVGGVALLGAGFWALPSGVAPAPLNLAGAQQALANLAGRELVSLKGWSPAEVFNHCAQSIEYSISGYPQLKPAWFRSSVGPMAFSVFAARGAMRHPLDEVIPGAAALDAPATQAQALERLQRAFERREIEDLRADVEVEPSELKRVDCLSARNRCRCMLEVEAKLRIRTTG